VASFGKGANGELDDRVRLSLGGKDVKVAESYEVTRSYLTQPAGFSLRLGSGDVVSSLMKLAQPKTPFQLYIGGVLQQTGEVDGYEAESAVGATELTIHGRDAMAAILDTYIAAEESYTDATYAQLVAKVITKIKGLESKSLSVDNADNRRVTTGVAIRAKKEPTVKDRVTRDTGVSGTVLRSVHAKLGERTLVFLRRHLDRAGLFLTAAADGNYILAAPNGNQPAIARIVCKRGGPANERSHVIRSRLRVDTSHRFSEIVVYARGHGRRHGRAKQKGDFLDNEMLKVGYDRKLVLRDANCTSEAQAEFLARRKIAEGCRAGFQLEYTMRGHSTPSLIDGSRCVWAPDTIVQVDDDELGIHDNYWVEGVVFRRNPQTTTTLHLMRVKDLVFGSDDADDTIGAIGPSTSPPKATPGAENFK
jgi:prophage tail gpP-like protein